MTERMDFYVQVRTDFILSGLISALNTNGIPIRKIITVCDVNNVPILEMKKTSKKHRHMCR